MSIRRACLLAAAQLLAQKSRAGQQRLGHASRAIAQAIAQLPPRTAPLGLGDTLLEWGGGQRWVAAADADPARMRSAAATAGGHATLFRLAEGAEPPPDGVFQPLAAPVAAITRRLKHEFDPAGLFNPDRLVMGI